MSILTCREVLYACFKVGRQVTIKYFLIQVNNDSIRCVLDIVLSHC
jgi:hypothetical protein